MQLREWKSGSHKSRQDIRHVLDGVNSRHATASRNGQDNRCPYAALIRADKEEVLARDGRPNMQPLDDIVVVGDLAIFEETL
jgi:hypothetical protein